MKDIHLKITYIGGPTALLELGGLRLLTDPTFDRAGEEYPTGFAHHRMSNLLAEGSQKVLSVLRERL